MMSWMKEDEVAKGRKEEIRATTKIILHLIDYMERHQMSQTDLARELGVTPQYINKLLHGQDKSFRIETAIEYGEKLGVKLVEIPEPEEWYDLVFSIGFHSSCIVRRELVNIMDYAVPCFKSNVLHSNQKQKWTQESQLVIA